MDLKNKQSYDQFQISMKNKQNRSSEENHSDKKMRICNLQSPEKKEGNLSHLMMKRDFLIRRGLVSSKNPADDVGPRSGAADIRQLLVPKRFDDVVEVGSSGYRIIAAE